MKAPSIGIKVFYDPDSAGDAPAEGVAPSQTRKAEVDIVFVHGLTGHRERTWSFLAQNVATSLPSAVMTPEPSAQEPETSNQASGPKSPKRNKSLLKKFFSPKQEEASTSGESYQPWPPALLPEFIPNARLLTWGYDADLAHIIGAVSTNNIYNHAQTLVRDLANIRRGAENRPIIFVGHSLGGIVIKDAINFSKITQQEDVQSIFPATYAVIFLGTPHRGSGVATLGKIASNVARVFLQDSNRTLLKELERESGALERISDAFSTLLTKPDVRIHSFREELGMSGVVGVGLVVDRNSSYIGDAREGKDTLHANHRLMPKVHDKDDRNFQRMKDVMKRYVDEAVNIVRVVEVIQQVDVKGKGKLHVHGNQAQALLPDGERQGDIEFDRFVNVPRMPTGPFFGRDSQLKLMKQTLIHDAEGSSAVLVMWGLGGIGKSRLCLEFANRHKDYFHTTFWVDARNSETCAASFAVLADAILDVENQKRPNLPRHMQASRFNFGAECGNEEFASASDKTIRGALKYMERSNNRWLLVFDSYEDRSLDLTKVFPSAGSRDIRILVSTWNRDIGEGLGQLVEVPRMSTSASAALLLSHINRSTISSSPGDENVSETENGKLAKCICEQLSNVPLAIEHAGRYIARSHLNLDEFQGKYQTGWEGLLKKTLTAPKILYEKNQSVYGMLELTVQHLASSSQEATDLLHLLSFFDNNFIRLSEICEISEGAAFTSSPNIDRLAGIIRNKAVLFQALEAIFDYSLAYEGKFPGSCAVHSLVQRLLQACMMPEKKLEFGILSTELIALHLNRDRTQCRPYHTWIRQHISGCYARLASEACFQEVKDRLVFVYEEFALFFESEKELLKSKLMYMNGIEGMLMSKKDGTFEYDRLLENLARIMSKLGEYGSAENLVAATLKKRMEAGYGGRDEEELLHLNVILRRLRDRNQERTTDHENASSSAQAHALSPKHGPWRGSVVENPGGHNDAFQQVPSVSQNPDNAFDLDALTDEEWQAYGAAFTTFDVMGIESVETFTAAWDIWKAANEGYFSGRPKSIGDVGKTRPIGETVQNFIRKVAKYHYWEVDVVIYARWLGLVLPTDDSEIILDTNIPDFIRNVHYNFSFVFTPPPGGVDSSLLSTIFGDTYFRGGTLFRRLDLNPSHAHYWRVRLIIQCALMLKDDSTPRPFEAAELHLIQAGVYKQITRWILKYNLLELVGEIPYLLGPMRLPAVPRKNYPLNKLIESILNIYGSPSVVLILVKEILFDIKDMIVFGADPNERSIYGTPLHSIMYVIDNLSHRNDSPINEEAFPRLICLLVCLGSDPKIKRLDELNVLEFGYLLLKQKTTITSRIRRKSKSSSRLMISRAIQVLNSLRWIWDSDRLGDSPSPQPPNRKLIKTLACRLLNSGYENFIPEKFYDDHLYKAFCDGTFTPNDGLETRPE